MSCRTAIRFKDPRDDGSWRSSRPQVVRLVPREEPRGDDDREIDDGLRAELPGTLRWLAWAAAGVLVTGGAFLAFAFSVLRAR